MPDVACVYTLVTPAGTVVFNDGSADQFYIGEIPSGLAGAPIRAPMDDLPYGDGGLSYNFWKGARHPLLEGVFLILSTRNMNGILTIRNQMEDDLRVALESISEADTATGTLTWRPLGLTQRALTVRNDVPLECVHDQNYLLRTFSFGLVADDPAWTEST